MSKFYKITKAQATLIGKFTYAEGQAVDPFVGEQVDGMYLVSETTYDLVKNNDKIKQVDFSKAEKIEDKDLNTKVIPL
jgi:hypothetical protein